MSDTVPPRVDEEVKAELVPTVYESETTADDQGPSTREVSVNGDVTSLSLSVLTLRSLGSAEASAVHAVPKPDASSEVLEKVSSDVGRAEFLAKEVPGSAAHTSDQETLLALTPGKVEETEVLPEFNNISISVPGRNKCEQFDLSSLVALDAEKPNERVSSSMLSTKPTVQLSNQPLAHSVSSIKIANSDDDDNNDDDLGADGNKIHDTLPIDLYYESIAVGIAFSGVDQTSWVSDKAAVSNGTSPLALTDHEDCISSGPGGGKWSLMRELTQLSRHGWYWGPISREEAEEKLTDQPEGAFLIRDSTDERYLFSLSFRSFNRTLHTRIEYCNGEFSFYHLPHSEGYRSLSDLIENAIHDSLNGIFYYSRSNTAGSHSYAVKLTKPVSRFTQVRSLQYLCRFIIRQHTRVDHIQNLPLPVTVKSWLRENQY